MVFSDAGRGGIIHVANIKGGVGKSTLATNLAASLSTRGPTLLIDLDVQGSAGIALGVDAAKRKAYSSWDLFRRRFQSKPPLSQYAEMLDVVGLLSKLEEMAIGRIVGGGAVEDAIVSVRDNLHVVPAGAEQFASPAGFQYGNFLHNIGIVKEWYKYIVIDTPSVWNRLTRFLYVNSDINLVPVTLDALSANSFKDYLARIKRLVSRNPHVRLRIVKNEVSRRGAGVKAKAGAASANSRFLDALCEEAALHNDTGGELKPKSLMLDLEIPESAAIRDAQDAGKSIYDHGGDPAAVAAFELLAKNVQYVLNGLSRENITASALEERVILSFKAAAVIFLAAVIAHNPAIPEAAAPRPIAPQQVADGGAAPIRHTFGKGDNATRMAKYAISVFRAMVPSQKEIYKYLTETVDAYNMTRNAGEPRIADYNRVPDGVTLSFYPPMSIVNKQEKAMAPAYKFFMDLVNDPYPYVTGDWCERGTGGGQPHYAMDVAGTYGSDVLSPVDGVAVLKTEALGGRTVAVLFDDEVIFFSHLDKRFVKTDDIVKKGMPIGTVGMTGRTSGPHVHIGYGIKSVTRHDVTFAQNSYRVTDPKHLFYKMAFDGSGGGATVAEEGMIAPQFQEN
jgi:cellulose biosynthesis protein BcsQ/murein DD-endopeptidase MepM/ murein hydrolase activator NlpD